MHTHNLLEVSVIGLLVNILGIFAFSHAHSHGGEACDGHGHAHDHGAEPCGGGHDHGHGAKACGVEHGHGAEPCGGGHDHGHSHGGAHGHADAGAGGSGSGWHTHEAPGAAVAVRSSWQSGPGLTPAAVSSSNAIKGKARSMVLDGVLLHVMADTLGSVSVIVSSLLIKWYGWMVADPICSLFTSLLILLSVYPLLKNTTAILMQRTPAKLEAWLLGCYQTITAMPGVVAHRDARFWTLAGNAWHGSIVISARTSADADAIRVAVIELFSTVGVNNMVVMVERF